MVDDLEVQERQRPTTLEVGRSAEGKICLVNLNDQKRQASQLRHLQTMAQAARGYEH